MAVSYNNLWKLLIDKGMNKTELKEASGISFNVMARMGKNETVSLESLEKICMVLNCNIGDIMLINSNFLNFHQNTQIIYQNFRFKCGI